ncbi:CENP-Q, a CENPA-CAD centromere complex subunit [Microdochium nivale]|nr:CENP-Q, a CENPA-CAD centromere complex subunit [Microdochium nivale]
MARLSWPAGSEEASTSNVATKSKATTKTQSAKAKPTNTTATAAAAAAASKKAQQQQRNRQEIKDIAKGRRDGASAERKQRSAKSLREAPAANQEEQREEENTTTAKRKRGRPSLNKTKNPSSNNADSAAQGQKRPRSSLPSEQPAAAASTTTTTTKRRGRPPARHAAEGASTAESPQPPPQADPEGARPKKRRRQSSDQPSAQHEPNVPDGGSPTPLPYRHLESRTRHVTRRTIEEKWEPLDKPSIANVTALFGSAARPVLLRLRTTQKHTQATAVLNAVGNRLRNKLSRGMPFPPPPPGGSTKREDELEFEKTIAALEALEYQLDPLLHSVQLLQREKERAEKELEREYKVLNRLTANARTAARERKGHLRKMHGLVPERQEQYDDDGYAAAEERAAAVKAVGDSSAMSVDSVFGGLAELEDKELSGLATQIANHMDSLKSNLRQIDGVVPAIGQSQAALRARLLEHFAPEVVDGVVLG